jgi:catechol 2,3-dioxygenase-like lactoylglutathione lyase family enzyme
MRLFSLSAIAVVFLGASCSAQTRPPIIGVSHIAVYTSNAAQTEQFYVQQIGLKKASDPENPQGTRYYVNQEQFVEVLPLPAKAGNNRLDHLGYMTANAAQLLHYLAAKGVTVPDKVEHASDGSVWFDVEDPEGNTVQFVQPPARLLTDKNAGDLYALPGANPIGRRMIHVGMVVHSEEKENTFYREILGFQPYWHGGMQPGKTDWVSQQVPDGHDWLEYMLTSGSSGSGIPEKISQKQMGVLNHFSLGVVNMEKSVTTLDAEDRLAGEAPRPQIGRDGKWQFNLYDPDTTRVELMEFTAASRPCCSGFTAANPTPTGQP